MSRKSTPQFVKSISVSIAATAFEWYDYALYGYFADIIGRQFFPSEDKLSGLLFTLGVFATGFAMRPLGAVLFGSLGDRLGRKPALVLSLLLMAIPTFCIALLPNYHAIGIWAPVGLLIIRLLQGLAVGGNYGGSVIFAVENAHESNRGLAGSWSVFSGIVGILMGSATATIFSWALDEASLYAWGWRLPFLLGIGACFLGFYIKRYIPETPTFENAKAHGKTSGDVLALPLRDILNRSRLTIFKAVAVVMLHDVGFYVLFVYLSTYMTTVLGIPMKTALTMNTLNMIVMLALIPVFAALSDRVGRTKVMMAAAIAFLILSFPLFLLMKSFALVGALGAQTVFAILKACYVGPLPTFVVERFPTHGRYSATALSLNISAALFGGTAPFLVTYLIQLTGWPMVPAVYLSLCALVSLFALSRSTERYKTPLNKI